MADAEYGRLIAKIVIDPWNVIRDVAFTCPDHERSVEPDELNGKRLVDIWGQWGVDDQSARVALTEARRRGTTLYVRVPVVVGGQRVWRGVRLTPLANGTIVIASYRCDHPDRAIVPPEEACAACPIRGMQCRPEPYTLKTGTDGD